MVNVPLTEAMIDSLHVDAYQRPPAALAFKSTRGGPRAWSRSRRAEKKRAKRADKRGPTIHWWAIGKSPTGGLFLSRRFPDHSSAAECVEECRARLLRSLRALPHPVIGLGADVNDVVKRG